VEREDVEVQLEGAGEALHARARLRPGDLIQGSGQVNGQGSSRALDEISAPPVPQARQTRAGKSNIFPFSLHLEKREDLRGLRERDHCSQILQSSGCLRILG
jgi:hypothetical protein